VRAAFRKLRGFDPMEIFTTRQDQASRRAFLDYRTDLARSIEEGWIAQLETLRQSKPHLDLVLTHVDDRFDADIRDAIGADAARVLPLLDKHSFTFLIEDPATVWHLGAQRYHTIAERYRDLTAHREQLAIDLNIVDRYQDVYPTRQQTGTELFQLVHNATANFQRVALYFESSLLPPDLALLPAAASAATRIDQSGSKTVVDSLSGVGLPWKGPALVDSLPWPMADDETVWLPPGMHSVEPAVQPLPVRVLRLNAELKSARAVSASIIEFTYRSAARALAVFDHPPRRIRVDGADQPVQPAGPRTIFLPPGQHIITLTAE